jgi:hypothetical protein
MQCKDVIITDTLDVQLKVVPKQENIADWKHLSDVEFPDIDCNGIELLIGADNPAAFITDEIRVGGPDEPWAFKYKLGWALMGPTNRDQQTGIDVHLLQHSEAQSEENLLSEEIYRFFKDDGLGVVTDTSRTMSFEDKKAKKIMEDSVSMLNGHYEVGMLWKDEDIRLPNNHRMALKRLEYLKARLQKDENLLYQYRKKIDEYVAKGYATKLTTDEAATTSSKTWYLPHHPVFHPNKPGKVRIVFDAAAKFEGTSLNDNLLHGPNLANNVVDVLLRFRQEKVAVMADIQEMFHQVRVPEDQRDSLRFLWFSPNLNDPPDRYSMNVHIFGAKDCPSIANFALK